MLFIELILNYSIVAITFIFLILLMKDIDKKQIQQQKKHNEELKQIFKEAIKESIEEYEHKKG